MSGDPDQRGRPDDRSHHGGLGRRPRALALLTVVMLLLGARMFMSSVTDLHRVLTRRPEVLTLDGSLDARQEALLRAQVVFANETARTRPGVMAAHAIARLGLGLVYLFAVAAVFSNDRRGRRAARLAGWVGLIVSLGNALFLAVWVRGIVPWLIPSLTAAMAEDASRVGRPAPSSEEVAQQASLFLVDVPIVVSGIGMVFSVVLLAYFGGRRMRSFYSQPKKTDHA